MKPWQDPRFRRATWLTLGVIGWGGLLWIAVMLDAMRPSRAGDDLRLLVDAARHLVDGHPLYSTTAAGGSLQAESLFYAYPPPVAQALTLVARLPSEVVLVVWGAGATLGLALVARLLGRPVGGLVLPALALAPYALPFAIAILFGNLDAWFPLAFGLVLAAVLVPDRRVTLAAGIALGAVSVAKLHPVSLGLWLLVRGWRERSGPELAILATALGTGLAIVAASLLLGGIAPWADYVAFVRSGAASSDLVSPLNVGPASQLALLFGLDDAAARTIQFVVTAGAVGVTAGAAWWIRDLVVSVGWATAASLIMLPVTWIHYPVALVPAAIAAAARAAGTASKAVNALLGAALAVAAAAVVAPVLIWGAMAAVLASAHASRTARRAP